MSQATKNYGFYLEDSGETKFKEWRDKINGPNDSNTVKIDDALHQLNVSKQPLLTGQPGQVVGFDPDGNAIPQEPPDAANAVTIEGGGTMVPPAGLGPGPYTMILDDEDGGGGGDSPPVPAADVTYDNASSGLEAETVQAAIDELSARDDSNPIGTIISFLGLTAPEGYLVCDGAAYSVADYPALSAFIAAQFGSANHFGGDGTATFAVPDMRNLFLRGYHGAAEEQLSGDIGARQEGTIIPRISSYAKESDISNANIAFPLVESNVYGTSDLINPDKRFVISNKTALMKGQTMIYTVNGDVYCEAYIPRPVNMAILYCIKAKTRT